MTTILVVDDEHSIVEFLATFLQEEGYQVVTAHNGEEGLAGLAVTRPAVVLCDVMMPVLDGREMCRRMQAISQSATMPRCCRSHSTSMKSSRLLLDLARQPHPDSRYIICSPGLRTEEAHSALLSMLV